MATPKLVDACVGPAIIALYDADALVVMDSEYVGALGAVVFGIVISVAFDALANERTDTLFVKGLFGEAVIVVPVTTYLFIETLADGGVVADGLPQPDDINTTRDNNAI